MRSSRKFIPLAHSRKNIQNKMLRLAETFKKSMSMGDYFEARKCCESVLALSPDNPSVLNDYALTLMRTGDHLMAYDIYMKMFMSKEQKQFPGNWLDGLAEVCGWLGKTEELQKYGHYSLTLSDQACSNGARYELPSEAPPQFDPSDKTQNVISFSLYGASPKYCETMIKNAEIATELYPAWACRVYYNDSVPETVINRLRELAVQLFDMTGESEITPTMWRFLVMDDPSVTRYLLRDADSLFSEKEVAAVNEWLASPYWFHHMRDYFTHTELLLAGLWGGCRGGFPCVKELMVKFVRQYNGSARFTDQQFLRSEVWPTVRQSILNHDEIFLFHHAQRYPTHAPVRWQTEHFHIGSNTSYSSIGGTADSADGSKITVRLETRKHYVDYEVNVQNGRWTLPLPFFLVDDYQKGELKITAQRG
ncbi:tetratricopeptide repeat protein [Pseudomonas sp. M30-35]|uniref:tetratricopeptide repeat protein n=1 Tax=Pseudomonas sp. M30-35 TaxID=1981174 RepID=UPI000B3C5A5D|nr:hypothetical protein [Pseudomonas sp. M30-35]ARU90160.1 hypothetical protein B9K09_20370 [Pseudomonas sp. M30-35]